MWRSSPIAPMIVRSVPFEMWAVSPWDVIFSSISRTSRSVAPAFKTMIIDRSSLYPHAGSAAGKGPVRSDGPGIGSQDFQVLGPRPELVDGRSDRLDRDVPLHVEEEEVFPRLRLHGPGFDLGEIDPVLRERLQHQVERPDLVPRGEQNRGLVVPGPLRGDLSDDDESGEIVRVVLDPLPNAGQSVDLGRRLPRDRRRGGVVRRQLRRAPGALHVVYGDGTQVPLEPAPALGDGVRMRVHLLYVLDVARHREQVVRHLHQDLPADQQGVVDEHVQRVADDSLAGVLDGDDAEIGHAALDGIEDLRDVDLRDVIGALSEVLEACQVCERRLGPQERHGERLLQRKGGRDDLAVDRPKRVVGKGAPVLRGDPPQDLDLALGDIKPELLLRLDLPDLDHGLRPAVEEGKDLVVQPVDFTSKLLEAFLRHPLPPAFRLISPISRYFAYRRSRSCGRDSERNVASDSTIATLRASAAAL